MPSAKTSPTQKKSRDLDPQKELNRLYRRRVAVIGLIRAIEEYMMVTESTDAAPSKELPGKKTKKPTLRVIYSRMLDEMLA
ncbi:hypothetical protein [Bryobacter aggregatus]|uniref:hypothetical protein n=1 Tax=Bryobacter aggregatus TaxID=360054 RepID=UPI0004E1570F|nr:hypothetical protein [Bryobacter aggregatus]